MVLSTIAIQPSPFSDRAVTALYEYVGVKSPANKNPPHIYPKTTFTKTVYIRFDADSIRYFAKITNTNALNSNIVNVQTQNHDFYSIEPISWKFIFFDDATRRFFFFVICFYLCM